MKLETSVSARRLIRPLVTVAADPTVGLPSNRSCLRKALYLPRMSQEKDLFRLEPRRGWHTDTGHGCIAPQSTSSPSMPTKRTPHESPPHLRQGTAPRRPKLLRLLLLRPRQDQRPTAAIQGRRLRTPTSTWFTMPEATTPAPSEITCCPYVFEQGSGLSVMGCSIGELSRHARACSAAS